MKRKLMGGRKLVEVIEEIISTCNWIVPPGCTSIDVFVVGGGGGGSRDQMTSGWSGAGGSGGQVVLVTEIPVISGSQLTVTVGAGGNDSSYGLNSVLTYNRINIVEAIGGSGNGGNAQTVQANNKLGGIGGQGGGAGKQGLDGVRCPFFRVTDPSYSNKYGASGAGGSDAYKHNYPSQSGGLTGAGFGGYGNNNSTSNHGGYAVFYGAGGGGGAFSSRHTYGQGGSGYQGIVIIHYYKYK